MELLRQLAIAHDAVARSASAGENRTDVRKYLELQINYLPDTRNRWFVRPLALARSSNTGRDAAKP